MTSVSSTITTQTSSSFVASGAAMTERSRSIDMTNEEAGKARALIQSEIEAPRPGKQCMRMKCSMMIKNSSTVFMKKHNE